jgi:hypothetical protein
VLRRLDPSEHLCGVGAALLGEPGEALLHRLERPFDGAGDRVVERDLTPGRGDDLRDAAAHLAGTDDKDMIELQIWHMRYA